MKGTALRDYVTGRALVEVCRHRPSPNHGTFAYSFYHIWGSPEAGITTLSENQFAEMDLALGQHSFEVEEFGWLGTSFGGITFVGSRPVQ
jgi:hypothetical protein